MSLQQSDGQSTCLYLEMSLLQADLLSSSGQSCNLMRHSHAHALVAYPRPFMHTSSWLSSVVKLQVLQTVRFVAACQPWIFFVAVMCLGKVHVSQLLHASGNGLQPPCKGLNGSF